MSYTQPRSHAAKMIMGMKTTCKDDQNQILDNLEQRSRRKHKENHTRMMKEK